MITRAAEDPASLPGTFDDLASIRSYAYTVYDQLVSEVIMDNEGKRLLVEHGTGDEMCERGNILLARQLQEYRIT